MDGKAKNIPDWIAQLQSKIVPDWTNVHFAGLGLDQMDNSHQQGVSGI